MVPWCWIRPPSGSRSTAKPSRSPRARVRRAERADAPPHPHPEPRPAGAGAVRLGRGGREQCDRGPHLQPAQEARQPVHRDGAQPGLRTGGRMTPRSTPEAAAPPRRGWSLRRRLLWAVMGASIGLWLGSLAPVVGVAWFATSEVFDDALDEGSRLVLQLAPQGDAAAEPGRAPSLGRDP